VQPRYDITAGRSRQQHITEEPRVHAQNREMFESTNTKQDSKISEQPSFHL
jgi:hypothetical protein